MQKDTLNKAQNALVTSTAFWSARCTDLTEHNAALEQELKVAHEAILALKQAEIEAKAAVTRAHEVNCDEPSPSLLELVQGATRELALVHIGNVFRRIRMEGGSLGIGLEMNESVTVEMVWSDSVKMWNARIYKGALGP